MSSKKPTSIALDYPSETFYYLKKVVCTSGPLIVNDTNSPGGKRTTTLFSVVLIDMKGCRVAVEVWGPYAVVIEDHFMKNHVDGGSVYILPDIAHGLLQFVLDRPTPFQIQQMDIDKRLVLDTKNSTSKRDLKLTEEAFPLPILFEVGKFTIDGVPIMEPNTWASLRPERTDNVAKVVPVITFEDFQRIKRAKKN